MDIDSTCPGFASLAPLRRVRTSGATQLGGGAAYLAPVSGPRHNRVQDLHYSSIDGKVARGGKNEGSRTGY